MDIRNKEISFLNSVSDTDIQSKQVSLDQIKQLLFRVSEQNLQDELFGELKKFENEYINLLETQKKLRDLLNNVKELIQPPLQHGITLFTEKDGHIVVGFQGMRYSVGIDPKAGTSIPPCSEVLLSQGGQAILKVLGTYKRGDSAEVLNFLDPVHPPEELDDGTKQNDDNCDSYPDDCKHFKRLHVRCGNNEAMVVETSEAIQREEINIGDIVRIDIRLAFAFEKLPSFEAGPLLLENDPNLSYDAIGGLKDQVGCIREAIELPYIHRELFKHYHLQRPKGILLFGPPGCGKTMIAKAIATGLTRAIEKHWQNLLVAIKLYQVIEKNGDDPELLTQWQVICDNKNEEEANAKNSLIHYITSAGIKINEDLSQKVKNIEKYLEDGVKSYFLNVKGPELLDKYVGETEHKIRKIFDEAKRVAGINTPVVIFFDEMEAMFQTRGSGISSDIEKTIVPQLLAEMDGVEGMENVIVIGASNRADLIDPAILRPGRLDIKIRIDRPNRDGAREIFKIYLLPETVGNTEDNTKEPLSLSLEGLPGNIIAGLKKDNKENHIRIAEILMEESLNLLYNEKTSLAVTSASGIKKNYPIHQFISGAIINSIVTRAKKEALKQYIDYKKNTEDKKETRGEKTKARKEEQGEIHNPDQDPGAITFTFIKEAIDQEFKENAEQMVGNLPEYVKQEFTVEINIKQKEGNKWDAPHPRPYARES